ncbi:MAG TPA: methyltransferase domain-containing protein [Candidatus Nanoarchaeia archaeon]|nr:methyltransferase domain-containing protein [Candidatus Nanoarchaeia archaeon]
MKTKQVDQMSKVEIVEAVRRKYDEVAADPYGLFSFPVGKWFAQQVGYPKKILDKLPDSLTESFTGANNPQPIVDIKKGETVLDLGCGAGLDLYFYSKASGPNGKVYGVDISEKMVKKAGSNMKKIGLTNVEVMRGRSDKIPLKDNSVDVVASNGVYNLSPYKESALKEVFRVLKPGGRNVFCEIMLKKALVCDIKTDVSYWFRCIGGSLPEQDFISLMKKAGFEKIKVISRGRNARTGHELAVYANIRAYKPKASR